jgi:hypothetical protein
VVAKLGLDLATVEPTADPAPDPTLDAAPASITEPEPETMPELEPVPDAEPEPDAVVDPTTDTSHDGVLGSPDPDDAIVDSNDDEAY